MGTADRATGLRPPLRALVVDDHEIVRDGLIGLLHRHRIEVVATAGDVASAVAALAAHAGALDVVVLDVRLPGGGAPEVLRQAPDGCPPVLAVSSSDERDDVVRTIRAGAIGYVLKSAPADDVAAAVRSTAAGEPVFSPQLAGHVLDLDLSAAATGDQAWEQLTDRQVEVLRLLARGRTYKEIAAELVVSVKTVESHVRRLLQALQLTNRHEAARWALDRGLE